MERNTEQKWTTLRHIVASQQDSGPKDGKIAASRSHDSQAVEPALTVLVWHPNAATVRLIRETLECFTCARVEGASDPLKAFEMSLLKPYRLFFFPMMTAEMRGMLLYEMISTAYARQTGPKRMAPGLVLIREKEDPPPLHEWSRDARVKDVVTKPLRIERLLQAVDDVLAVHDPTVLR